MIDQSNWTDIGHDHLVKYTIWNPDDLPSNRKWLRLEEGEPMPLVDKWGLIIKHKRFDGADCESCLTFDGPWQRLVHQFTCEKAQAEGKPEPKLVVWQVECWEPLTISPSVLCKVPIPGSTAVCGDHGHIKKGRWEPC